VSTWQEERQRDFTGGENLLLLPEFMQGNQLLSAQNCVLTPEGVPETRLGKALIVNSLGLGGILALIRWAKEDGTKYLTAQHGTSLYSAEWDGVTYPISLGVAIRDDLTVDSPLSFEVWKDMLICGNGTDNSFRFSGTTCTDLVGAPKFSIFCVRAGRLWVVDSATGLIRFSDLETYDSWDALNIIRVRSGDGDTITGLAPLVGGMVITKQNSVFPVYGTSLADLRIEDPISDNFGCVATKTLLRTGLFLGDSGLFSFNLNSLQPAFETHRTLIRALTQAQKAESFGIVHPRERRAYINLGDGKTLAICQQQRIDTSATYYSCFTWTGLNAGCFALCDSAGDDGSLLIGDKTNGIIYKLSNETDDDGIPIETLIATAYKDQGSAREKIWRFFIHEMEAVNVAPATYRVSVDVDYSVLHQTLDYAGDSINILTWDVDNWDEKNWGPSERISNRYDFDVRGNRVSFAVSSQSRLKFLGYITKFREVGYL
jgi:hypothetical protein